MQRLNYFSASFVVTAICLLNSVVFAQAKTQISPVVISAVAPIFTPAARVLGLKGNFYVDVEIDRNGKVVSSKTIEGTHKLMQKVLEEAADRWRFAPDENAEKRRHVQLIFTFKYVPQASGFDSTTVFYPPYKIEVRDNKEFKVEKSGKPNKSMDVRAKQLLF